MPRIKKKEKSLFVLEVRFNKLFVLTEASQASEVGLHSIQKANLAYQILLVATRTLSRRRQPAAGLQDGTTHRLFKDVPVFEKEMLEGNGYSVLRRNIFKLVHQLS